MNRSDLNLLPWTKFNNLGSRIDRLRDFHQLQSCNPLGGRFDVGGPLKAAQDGRFVEAQTYFITKRESKTNQDSRKNPRAAALRHIFSVCSIDQITAFEETFHLNEMAWQLVDYTFKKALSQEVEDAIQAE